MESYDEWKGVEGLDLVGGASFFPHMSEEWKELTLKKQNEVGQVYCLRDEDVFFVEKQYMGRIIGKKGVTINDLQRRSSTDLQVNQDVPPGRHCEITIRGSRQAIEMAKQMLTEVIEIGTLFGSVCVYSFR